MQVTSSWFFRARAGFVASALFGLALGLAGCGTQATETPGAGALNTTAPKAATGPTTVGIDMTGFGFTPAVLTITAGSTIVWTNKEAAKHTVTENNRAFDSGTMEQGATFSRKFDAPGKVAYFCKFHGGPGSGMFGTIQVVAASGTAEPAPGTPPAAPAASSEVRIAISGFKFGSGPLTVKLGTKVTWTNQDDAKHTATADDGSWDSGPLAKGQSFSFTFTKSGTFPYYCAFHGGKGGQGMSSSISVGP